jgi:hypothetical protein
MGRPELTRRASDSSAWVRASKRPSVFTVTQEYTGIESVSYPPLLAANLPACGVPHLCKQDSTDIIINGACATAII